MISQLMYNNSNNNGTTSASVDETIIEAAAPIIAGLILDSNTMTWVDKLLDPNYSPLRRHQFIIQVIKSLHTSKKPIDRQRVRLELHRRRQLEEAGGDIALAKTLERTVSAVNIDSDFLYLILPYGNILSP